MPSASQKGKIPVSVAGTEFLLSYGEALALPPGRNRTWHDLPSDTQSKLQKTGRALLLAAADKENLPIDQELRAAAEDIVLVNPFLVRWANGEIVIFPWLDMETCTAFDIIALLSKLPPDSISIGFVSHIHTQACGEVIQRVRAAGYRFIGAAPDDLDALAQQSWTLTELVIHKLTKLLIENEVDVEAVYTEWQVERFKLNMGKPRDRNLARPKTAANGTKYEKEDWVHHPDSDRLVEAVRTSNFVLLSGKSSSGKTILALSVGERMRLAGRSVWYIDVGNLTSKSTYDVALSLLRKCLDSDEQLVLIIDDIQTQGTLGESLIRFLNYLQLTVLRNKLTIIGICWPEFEVRITEMVKEPIVLTIKASSLADELIRKFGAHLQSPDIETIRLGAGDDLYLLRIWLENSQSAAIANSEVLARKVWQERTKNVKVGQSELRRILAVSYLIGQYECDTSEAFLQNQTGASKKQISELVRAKLLVRKGEDGELLSPPHRSFARFMLEYIGRNKETWGWLKSRGVAASPGQVLVNFLEAIDPSQIWSVLKLIEQGEALGTPSRTQEQIQAIAAVWKSTDRLLKKLEDQQLEDPTWGNAISSAFFACQALCTVGKYGEAKGSIDFLRTVYGTNDGRLEVDTRKLSTVSDFAEIKKRFAREEQIGAFDDRHNLESSENADMELFHANWASGLILGAEAYYKELSSKQLTELAIAVEKRVERGDFFYPARVPWATARVLLGLAECKRTVDNSPVVRRVADWLLRSREDGGARDGIGWNPGTGGWNTPMETTGMVISALLAVGVPGNNPIIRRAMDHLYAQKTQWTRAGNELDGAIALDSYLALTGDWVSVQDEALYLARWADTIALWRNATVEASKTQEQTCRAAATAAFLIKPMWVSLRKDVPELLMALGASLESTSDEDAPMQSDNETDSSQYDVAISYASENRDYVERVARCLRKAGLKIFYDRFEEVDTWGKNLYSHLDEVYRKRAKYCVMFLSEDYARKVWTNHERESAQARAFSEGQEYILPVRFDNTEIPGVLPTTAYLDALTHSSAHVCKLIQAKLRG